MSTSKELLLREASQTILDLAEQVEHLREIIGNSISLKIAGIDLSKDQTLIDSLDAEYQKTKTSILTLASTIP